MSEEIEEQRDRYQDALARITARCTGEAYNIAKEALEDPEDE